MQKFIGKHELPYLHQYGSTKQLIIDGKPFLMLGGELQNSSFSSAEYMHEVGPKLKAANLNTILGAVSWEMIEPTEGTFYFAELDKSIEAARHYGLRVILLWFGTWKNGKSTYVPSWVKIDPDRFPRAELRKGKGIVETTEVLSLFHDEGLKADMKAFSALMNHIKDFDQQSQTVIMIQVENEVGLLGDSRDGSALANEVFGKPVPEELVEYLDKSHDELHPSLKRNLEHFKSSKEAGGSWERTFGKSLHTDELFMAFHYAKYLNSIAHAGKEIYALPMFTNVWLNNGEDAGENSVPVVAGGGSEPGDYPSGGAVSTVLDIWLQFAPKLDFIAPDIYLTSYTRTCETYRHRGNALVIPEQRRDEFGVRRIWEAFGTHGALLASPFGIDTVDAESNPWTRHYGLLAAVSKIVLEAQQKPGSSIGFSFDDLPAEWKRTDPDPDKPIHHIFGSWRLTITRSFVFGTPGPGSGMIIHLGSAKFLLLGWGFQVSAQCTDKEKQRFSGILSFEEKAMEDSSQGVHGLKTRRLLGGDETRSGKVAVMPNEKPDYAGFPIAVTIPARTAIAEVEFYAF